MCVLGIRKYLKSLFNRFRPAIVSTIIHQVLENRLRGQTYTGEASSAWSKEIADEIRNRLKELDLVRYKYVVHVLIGEMRGEGVHMGCRCFWDSDTDNMAKEKFENESLFCVATVFGVYHY
ncbi:Tctex-1 [Cladochytrium replicatum]|nr:Tctex-1 [Cladochytrium replicatum]